MSKISQGNKFRKVVQIEFKTEKEYAVLHQYVRSDFRGYYW